MTFAEIICNANWRWNWIKGENEALTAKVREENDNPGETLKVEAEYSLDY